MTWYIVYKCKSAKGNVKDHLKKANNRYYIPEETVERYEDGRMTVAGTKPFINNLIFIYTDQNIYDVTNRIDGLRTPYLNCSTHHPATVKATEMERFIQVVEAKNIHACFLPDAYQRFEHCPRVRVRAGDFEGLEGRVFRIRGDRKLIISIDEMSVAISGIHHTLLELIDDDEAKHL